MLTIKRYTGAAVTLGLAALFAAAAGLRRSESPHTPSPDSKAADSDASSLPERVIARLGSDRLRRPERFTSVAYSPDGSTLASASYHGTVRLWDAAKGGELATLTREDGGYAVAFSPKGGILAAAGLNGSGVHLWKLHEGRPPELVFPESSSPKGGGIPLVMAFSPDGLSLALGSPNGLGLRVWDVESKKDRFTLTSESYVGTVAFSPDGKLLASGAGYANVADKIGDIGVRLWDVGTGKAVATLEGHKLRVNSVAFAPDGKTLASSSFDGTIRIWDVAKGETIRCIEAPVGLVAFSPDGKKLAVASLNTLCFLDPASGERLLEIADCGGALSSLSFSPDGKKLAVAGGSGAIQIWDTATGEQISPREGHLDAVSDVVFSPDRRTLASRGGDRSVRLWDLATFRQKRALSIGPGRFFGDTEEFRLNGCGLAFAQDGKEIASIGGSPVYGDAPNSYVWDVASGELKTHFAEPRLPFSQLAHPPWALAVGPDGTTLATCGDGGVRLWSLSTDKEVRLLPTQRGTKTAAVQRGAAFLADGRTLAAVCDDRRIRLWDWQNGTLARTIFTGDSWFTYVVASPDGQLLATCGAGPVQVWETASGKLVRTFGDAKRAARRTSFASDGRRLVAATKDSVDVWDVLTGEELSAHDGKPLLSGGHKGAILCAAISPDGKTIASGSEDTTILLWDAHDLLPRTPAADLGAKDLDRLWDDLRSDDAPTAYKAVLALAGVPDKAAAFLKERVPAEPAPEAKRVQGLIRQLNDDDAQLREAASKELAGLGEAVEPALREALAGDPPPETRGRCERLLEALNRGAPDADAVRRLRAVQALEQVGTPDARATLKALAAGAPGPLSRAARAALDALERRAP